ncbi:MAG: hypothetical protein KGP14_07205 [Betaproteobacteria bacterium]|nr:hypothetical protein [Betaproteobacteria bacterium]
MISSLTLQRHMNSQGHYQHFGQHALVQPPQGPLAKLVAFLLSATFLTLAFMFSLVALAVVAVAGLAFGGWLWWRTRQLRKETNRAKSSPRQNDSDAPMNRPDYTPSTPQRRSATVIEGEAVRMTEEPSVAQARQVK